MILSLTGAEGNDFNFMIGRTKSRSIITSAKKKKLFTYFHTKALDPSMITFFDFDPTQGSTKSLCDV